VVADEVVVVAEEVWGEQRTTNETCSLVGGRGPHGHPSSSAVVVVAVQYYVLKLPRKYNS
jgi:hypothetical protein